MAEIRYHNDPAHLVAIINTSSGGEGSSRWTGFNDFLVQPIHENEAVQFHKWKVIKLFLIFMSG